MNQSLPRVMNSRRIPVPLERELARGGEGAVFSIANDLDFVAKVYLPKADRSAERGLKLSTMAELGRVRPNLLKIAAWPVEVLHEQATGQFCGFLMPRVSNAELVQALYNPVQRLKLFPTAGWDFQIWAAKNLAAAFEEVHHAGCLVADVSQSNAMVTPSATVVLLDCDSFQVPNAKGHFLCDVGTPHFTPPELQGRSLRGFTRTANHDRFGLAVLIYQLLFVGRHPYAGKYTGKDDPSFEELIAQFRFAQGPMANSWNMAPPPHTPTFGDIPPDVQQLFRRAFERGSERGTRPAPNEWGTALKALFGGLKVCRADEGHHYWRGAPGCPWCRLSANGGPEYYYGVSTDPTDFVVDESRLQQIIGRLNQVRDVEYRRDQFILPACIPQPLSPAAKTASKEHLTLSVTLGLVTIACSLAILLGIRFPIVGVIAGMGAAGFGGWWFLHYQQSPRNREYRLRKQQLRAAKSHLASIESRVMKIVSDFQANRHTATSRVQHTVSEARSLAGQYATALQRLTAEAESLARLRHLRLHQLSDAEISGIGEGLKQILLRHSITTAADINEKVIRAISGFGPQRTALLVGWREKVLQKFQFDVRRGISPAQRRATISSLRARQSELLAHATATLDHLEQLHRSCRETLEQAAPGIRAALQSFRQADANLKVLR